MLMRDNIMASTVLKFTSGQNRLNIMIGHDTSHCMPMQHSEIGTGLGIEVTDWYDDTKLSLSPHEMSSMSTEAEFKSP